MNAYLRFFGMAVLVTFSTVFYAIFLSAYFMSDKMALVMVDTIGEAHIEFICFPIFLTFGLFAAFKK